MSVKIDVYRQAKVYMETDPGWAPTTRETADHSLPFAVATALHHGVVDAASFDDERLSDETLLRLARATRVEVDDGFSARYPASAPCRITVETEGGAVHVITLDSPDGHGDRPMSDTMLEQKFRDCATPHLGALACEKALDTIWNLAPSMPAGPLTEAIAGPGGR